MKTISQPIWLTYLLLRATATEDQARHLTKSTSDLSQRKDLQTIILKKSVFQVVRLLLTRAAKPRQTMVNTLTSPTALTWSKTNSQST